MRIALYVVAGWLVLQTLGALYSTALLLVSLLTRPAYNQDVSRFALSGLLTAGLYLGLAACIFFVARRYGEKLDEVVRSYLAKRKGTEPDRAVRTSRSDTKFTAMRVVFYLIAFITAGPALLSLVALPLQWAVGMPDMPRTGPGLIGLTLLYILLPLGLGIYFYWLAGRCKPEPGKDIRPYIRQGGFVILGLGVIAAGFTVWLAINCVRGEADEFAPLAILFAAPVVVTLWALGVAALVVARR